MFALYVAPTGAKTKRIAVDSVGLGLSVFYFLSGRTFVIGYCDAHVRVP